MGAQVNDASQGSLTVGTSAVITHTVAYYGKREAEAAPEAKADPYLLYGGYYGHGLGYGYGGYYGHGSMATTERGVLMLSLRPRPTPTCCTVATMAMVLDMVMATATLMEDMPTTDKV